MKERIDVDAEVVIWIVMESGIWLANVLGAPLFLGHAHQVRMNRLLVVEVHFRKESVDAEEAILSI